MSGGLSVGIIDIDAVESEIAAVEERTRELAQESQAEMNLVLAIENMGIQEFCRRTQQLSLFEQTMDPPMNAELVLVFAKERTVQTPMLFNATHMLPYVDGSTISIEIRSDTGRLMDGGILIDQFKGDTSYGIFVYLPFTYGKKIYGFYHLGHCTKNRKNIRQYFSVGECKESEPIPSIQLPDMTPRNLDSELTDNDRILAANSSPRFRKLSENWVYLGEGLNDLNGLMRKTIDPNYLEKIMMLNNQLSYPPFSRQSG